jgi:hypothetical protein
MESADCENSRREWLRFLRTAEIDGDKFWLWTYTESGGVLCYVYAHQRANGRRILGLLSAAGRTPEGFLQEQRKWQW